MSLLIACILIYGFKLNWGWYVFATILYSLYLLIEIRLLNMKDEMHSEIIEKINSQNVNINEQQDLFSPKEMKKWKKHIKNLH